MWQLFFASRHRLIPQQQEEQQQDAKRVPDGHGRSFGCGPWQKGPVQLNKIIPNSLNIEVDMVSLNVLFSLYGSNNEWARTNN